MRPHSVRRFDSLARKSPPAQTRAFRVLGFGLRADNSGCRKDDLVNTHRDLEPARWEPFALV